MQSTKILRVVSVFDDAIDRERTSRKQMERYAETRDYSLLTFKTDRAPTVFHIRRIPVHAMTRFVEVVPTIGEQCERAFMCGVEKIEGLRDETDAVLAPRAPGKRVESATGDTHWWSESEIEELIDLGALDKPTFEEIGGVALTRAGLRRGSEASYRLPPSSHAGWGALVSRHAEHHEKIVRQSSAELAQ